MTLNGQEIGDGKTSPKKILDKQSFLCYNKGTKEREVIQMANKKKKNDRRAFKKTGEELQQWLVFTRRGNKVESGKKYNRQKFKKGDKE